MKEEAQIRIEIAEIIHHKILESKDLERIDILMKIYREIIEGLLKD